MPRPRVIQPDHRDARMTRARSRPSAWSPGKYLRQNRRRARRMDAQVGDVGRTRRIGDAARPPHGRRRQRGRHVHRSPDETDRHGLRRRQRRPGRLVVVFPTDSSAWSDYGLTHGACGARTLEKRQLHHGLPAGECYVAAINEETTPQWREQRGLEELARSATQVRLVEGEARMQDVKTVKGGSQ